MDSNNANNTNTTNGGKNMDISESNERDIEITIDISNNYYEAYITILIDNDSVSVHRDDILEALNKRNVVYGIKNDVIDSIINNPKNIKKTLIAKGDSHENGEDGKIEYHFDVTNKNKPKLLSNGTVDHKELNYFLKASKGEILSKKILPTQGKDGTTVTGRTIKGKPGKRVEFKKGKNITISNDGMFLLAQAGGMIKFEDEKISIIKVLEISDDVGITTGNIHFEGKIIVRGNVESGYTIHGGDDVEIFGIVQGSEINGKNIIIHKGIHNNARLVAEGDIRSKFMESCYAKAKGDIICDAIIHCKIECLGKIVVEEKKGLILGGNINARSGVTAKIIGSQTGSTTRIYVGIDEKLLIDLKETKKLIEETKIDLEKINQAINVLQIKRSKDPKKEIFLNKYVKARDQYISLIKSTEEKMKELYSLADSLKSSKISCNYIYPGTNLRINNSHYIVKNALANVKLIKENGQVVVSPLV